MSGNEKLSWLIIEDDEEDDENVCGIDFCADSCGFNDILSSESFNLLPNTEELHICEDQSIGNENLLYDSLETPLAKNYPISEGQVVLSPDVVRRKVRPNVQRRKERLAGISSMYALGEYLESHDTAVKYFQKANVLTDRSGEKCSGKRPDTKGRNGLQTNIPCKGVLKVRETKEVEKRWYRYVRIY